MTPRTTLSERTAPYWYSLKTVMKNLSIDRKEDLIGLEEVRRGDEPGSGRADGRKAFVPPTLKRFGELPLITAGTILQEMWGF